MSPLIGGGLRISTKAGSTVLNKINNKLTVKNLLPDGNMTKFSQGETGDCAFLSFFDGLLNNNKALKHFQNNLITDANGDYWVTIGDSTVKVLKDSLSDETLSDKTGIKLFEQAYKQIAGSDSLNGGFADNAAKQFGLNPVHIDSGSITDEVLEKISKQQDLTILSLGLKVDADGVLDIDGDFQHYFSIKNVDTDSKTVSVVDTYDASKTIDISFDDIKVAGVSIDGGSLNKVDLPNVARNTDEKLFYGIDASDIKNIDLSAYPQNIQDGFKKVYSAVIDEGNENVDKIKAFLYKKIFQDVSYQADADKMQLMKQIYKYGSVKNADGNHIIKPDAMFYLADYKNNGLSDEMIKNYDNLIKCVKKRHFT